ncbi:MAG: PAS domain S-box protein, partial [Smithella sp.]
MRKNDKTNDRCLIEIRKHEQITEMEKSETKRKLAEAEELYKTLAESSFAVVFIVQDGKYRFINTSAIAYAGYTSEELV